MPYIQLSPAEEMKLTIIENFIDHYLHDDKDREQVKEIAFQYVTEDHINELDKLLPNERVSQEW